MHNNNIQEVDNYNQGSLPDCNDNPLKANSFTELTSRNFTMVQNGLIRSSELSCKAFKLLCIGLSHSGKWVFTKDQVGKCFKEGEHTVNEAVKELREFGYLHLHARKLPNGKVGGWIWFWFEKPKSEAEFKLFNRKGGFPVDGDFRPTENHPDLRRTSFKKTKKEEEEQEEKRKPSSSLSMEKEKSSQESTGSTDRKELIKHRMQNKNFASIAMPQEDRNCLVNRGAHLTNDEWNNVCLRFIQRSKEIEIDPVAAYFTTLIKNKAEPVIDREKAKSLRATEKRDTIFDRELAVKSIKDKYQNNRYWSGEVGNFIRVSMGVGAFFQYQFAGEKISDRILYEGERFLEVVEYIKKRVAGLKPVK